MLVMENQKEHYKVCYTNVAVVIRVYHLGLSGKFSLAGNTVNHWLILQVTSYVWRSKKIESLFFVLLYFHILNVFCQHKNIFKDKEFSFLWIPHFLWLSGQLRLLSKLNIIKFQTIRLIYILHTTNCWKKSTAFIVFRKSRWMSFSNKTNRQISDIKSIFWCNTQRTEKCWLITEPSLTVILQYIYTIIAIWILVTLYIGYSTPQLWVQYLDMFLMYMILYVPRE